MNIKVNGKLIEIESNYTIANLLVKLNFPDNSIAVAVNNQLVKSPEREGYILKENDNVVIIKATCGG